MGEEIQFKVYDGRNRLLLVSPSLKNSISKVSIEAGVQYEEVYKKMRAVIEGGRLYLNGYKLEKHKI